MEIIQETSGDAIVVSLVGRLDTTNYNKVETEIINVIDQNENSPRTSNWTSLRGKCRRIGA